MMAVERMYYLVWDHTDDLTHYAQLGLEEIRKVNRPGGSCD